MTVLSTPVELAEWLGVTPLISATIRITKRCDATCAFCYSSSRRRLPTELTRDEWLRVVRELGALGALRLFVSGGEPTLVPHLPEVVQAARSGGMKVALSSHGGHLTDDLVRSLFDAGLAQLQVSVDDVGESHDRSRGIPGLYARAMRAVERAATVFHPHEGREVIVACVVGAWNMERIHEVYLDAAKAGARGFCLVPFVPTGRGSGRSGASMKMTLDVGRAIAARRRPGEPEVRALVPPAIADLEPKAPAEPPGYLHSEPFELAVDCDGDVAMSDVALNPPKAILGNVRNTPLASLYRKGLASWEALAPPAQKDMIGVCSVCALWERCGGGSRHWTRGTGGGPSDSDVFCQSIFEERAFPERYVMRQGAPQDA